MNLLASSNFKILNRFLILIMVFALGCDDIFVEDISTYALQLKAPSSGWKSEDTKVGFSWEKIPKAVNYKLEVVTPGFAVSHKLVFEKLLVFEKFDTSLITGDYEWRVKAMNSASATDFFTSSFSILPAFNISSRLVVLKTPDDHFVSNVKNVDFRWEALTGAGYYSFKIKKENWAGDSVVVAKLNTPGFTFQLDDGFYTWGVAAIDTATGKKTDYSIRSITVDKNPPSVPVLISPANKDTISSVIAGFVWRKTEKNAVYTVEVYSDSELKNKFIEKTISDTATYINLEKGGSYFWRVNSKDQYGNTSDFSPVSTFSAQLPIDIHLKTVQIMSPNDKSTVIDKKVTFWWNSLSGAEKYNLQIVSPTFANPTKLIYDQKLTSNSVAIDLDAGNYEWRVKAINSTTETVYSQASLLVYNIDLTKQNISLLKPLYAEQLNRSVVKFSWEKLSSNVNYHLLVKKDSWESGTVVQEFNTKNSEMELSFLDGDYFWGVKAVDLQNSSETPYSVRKFGIDLIAPDIPKLTLPANNFTTGDFLVSFSWEPSDATDTKLTYTLEMFQVNTTSVVQLLSKTTQQKTIGYNFESLGKYKWRVSAIDNSGNQSAFSEFRYLEIK